MSSPRRLVLIEFNELCPTLLRRFMDEGRLPFFKQLHDSSVVCITDAEEEAPNLEPWIQWPTVHFGVPYAQHQIFHLGDGRQYAGRGLATSLSDAGVRVGVFGSMNLNYGPLNGYVIPDPWDRHGRADPEWLQPFYETIAGQVQESSRTGSGNKAQMARFGWFLASHGLTSRTTRAIAAQLWAERRDPGLKWRRASILDHIQYDIAHWLNRRLKIQFATFFCNSTAHYQHYFWRNMEPARFVQPPADTDHRSLREAIVYGYQQMDVLIGRFLADYPDAVLMLCSALSQQPWVDTTKCTYRPHDFGRLLHFAGVELPRSAVKPVMAEEFTLSCGDDQEASTVEQRLHGLLLDGQRVLKVQRDERELFAGCAVQEMIELDRAVIRSSDGASCRFGDLFYMIHAMRSGRHHPDGVFWVRSGTHRVTQDRLPLTAIAPMILKHFGVSIPPELLARPQQESPPATLLAIH